MAKFCIECGAAVPEQAKYCGECGAALNAIPEGLSVNVGQDVNGDVQVAGRDMHMHQHGEQRELAPCRVCAGRGQVQVTDTCVTCQGKGWGMSSYGHYPCTDCGGHSRLIPLNEKELAECRAEAQAAYQKELAEYQNWITEYKQRIRKLKPGPFRDQFERHDYEWFRKELKETQDGHQALKRDGGRAFIEKKFTEISRSRSMTKKKTTPGTGRTAPRWVVCQNCNGQGKVRV